MALHQLLYGGLHLFSAAMGPGVSGPSFSEAPWATRICPVIHYSVQSGGGHRGGGGGRGGGEGGGRGVSDSGGRTPGGHQQRQDGWLTRKKKNTPDTPHPSPTPKPERRQMRGIKKR